MNDMVASRDSCSWTNGGEDKVGMELVEELHVFGFGECFFGALKTQDDEAVPADAAKEGGGK
ncbi:MAG: hypothetical protein EOM20_21260, partial [Spartobacteria bacterium]|nr:hypothetical protein [Spartobacteria bacterium]